MIGTNPHEKEADRKVVWGKGLRNHSCALQPLGSTEEILNFLFVFCGIDQLWDGVSQNEGSLFSGVRY